MRTNETAAGSASVKRKRYPRVYRHLSAYMMMTPAIILLIIFVIIPIIYGFYLSFHRWDGFNSPVFIGTRNYIRLIERDDVFLKAVTNTIIFAISVVLVKNVLGLFLALLVNQKIKGVIFFRTALFLPVTLSFVVIGLLWSWIYNPTFGLLNAGLELAGLDSWIRAWLSDQATALGAIITVDIWKWTGFHMVLFLAGLQSIPRDLYEVAIIDGAGAWTRLTRITLPLLAPVTFISVLLSLNGAFVRNFELVFVMTDGGPNHTTEVVLTHLVTQAFRFGKLGYASAMGFALFVVVAVIAFTYIRIGRSGAYNF